MNTVKKESIQDDILTRTLEGIGIVKSSYLHFETTVLHLTQLKIDGIAPLMKDPPLDISTTKSY